MHRRTFLQAAALLPALGAALPSRSAAPSRPAVRVGMCDWNLGPPCSPELIPKAEAARLGGLQVSIGTNPRRIPLREPAVRRRYRELGRRHGIAFPSVAAGQILNEIPLKSEPQSAVYVIDAVEAAAALGAGNVLLAFFNDGDLRRASGPNQYTNLSEGPYASYALDEAGLERVAAALRQVAPRAEDAGVILGIESTLTAEQHLALLEAIGSPAAQVYYDVGNATAYGYDAPAEIRRLGAARICQIHLKDWKTPLLGSPEGEVNFAAVAEACRDIGYEGWFVLETSGREGRFAEDTAGHVAWAQQLFG